MGPIGIPELLILLAVLLLVFGARKLPELGRGLGSGMREFKEGVTGKDDEPRAIEESRETAAPEAPRPDAAPVAQPSERASDDAPAARRDA